MANVYNNSGLPKIYSELVDNILILLDFGDGGSSSTITDKSDNLRISTLDHGSSGDNDSFTDMWTNGGTNGLNFDGSEDKVTITYDADFQINNNITLEIWVKLDATGINQGFITRGNDLNSSSNSTNYRLQINTSGNIEFYFGDGDDVIHKLSSDTVSPDITKYHHIIVTHEYGSITNSNIYYDGQDVNATYTVGDGLGTPKTHSSDVNLGCTISSTDTDELFLNGSLLKVAIYDTVLTARQIQHIYNFERLSFSIDVRPDKAINMTAGIVFRDI